MQRRKTNDRIIHWSTAWTTRGYLFLSARPSIKPLTGLSARITKFPYVRIVNLSLRPNDETRAFSPSSPFPLVFVPPVNGYVRGIGLFSPPPPLCLPFSLLFSSSLLSRSRAGLI